MSKKGLWDGFGAISSKAAPAGKKPRAPEAARKLFRMITQDEGYPQGTLAQPLFTE